MITPANPAQVTDAMVEAVARAICSAAGFKPDDCYFGSGSAGAGTVSFICYTLQWERYKPHAQSAIAAIGAGGQAVAADIGDAVLGWMVKYDLLDGDNEYQVADVMAVMDDLVPSSALSQPHPADERVDTAGGVSNKAEEGRQAYKNRQSKDSNPYPQGSARYWQWSSGWLDERTFRPHPADEPRKLVKDIPETEKPYHGPFPPNTSADERVVEALRENLRRTMLEQPTSGRRETFTDGYHQGLCRALELIDAALAAAGFTIIHRDENHGPTLERAAWCGHLQVLKSVRIPRKTARSGLTRKAFPHEIGKEVEVAIDAMEKRNG